MNLAARCLVLPLFLSISAAAARAEVKTKAVPYEHGGGKFTGFLAWDDAKTSDKTPQPGVLVFPEWWGNNDYAHTRARQLAELGYVALAVDMYGEGRVTKDPAQAQKWSGELYGDVNLLRARAQAGMAQLVAQAQVDRARIAAIGYCFGGTVALELARTGADLCAVVAFHAGKLGSLGKPEDSARITAAVTICHGQNDDFVSKDDIAAFHAQMKGSKHPYQFLSYSGAVHAFTNREADSFKIPGVAYDATADHRSWGHMRQALEDAFVVLRKR